MSDHPEAEIRVTRRDKYPTKIEHLTTDGRITDLTPLLVVRVARIIEISDPPEVQVTFRGRLVEVDQ